MDSHHKANYSIGALLGAGLIAITSAVSGIESKVGHVASREWPELTQAQTASLASRLAALPHREVTIYCVSGCGTMPEDLQEAFNVAGWTPHVESVLASTVTGLAVSPDRAEGKAVADAIRNTIGINPMIADQDGGAFAVTVGRKRK